MKYNKENIKSNNFLFFWGNHRKNENVINETCLSQWYYSPFSVDGIMYSTAEQYMMYQKALLFKDSKIASLIIDSKHPREAKSLGRLVKNYDEKIWLENKTKLVIKGNIAKFSQNQEIFNFLIHTFDKVLVEASPYDKIWGIGLPKEDKNCLTPSKWKGLNLLGFCLMEVRDELLKISDNKIII